MVGNIVFVINHLERGGAAKMLKYVANVSTSIFNEVSIICLFEDDPHYDDIDKKIKLIGLGMHKASRKVRWYKMIKNLRREIKIISPKYVCSFISHVCVITSLATVGMKELVKITAERGDPYTQPIFWKWLTKWSYRTSDYTFFQLDRARDFFGQSTIKHSFVIPNPFVTNLPIDPYLGERNKTIVTAGRFSFEKKFDVLIEAFAIVKKQHPEYSLKILGEGALLADYKMQAKNLHIEDCVIFPGYVKSVAKEIQQDGIFVLSSLFEGMPNSLIEAMSVGIPCVSTNCTPGGPAFLFKNEERGILSPVNDVHKMAEAINYYIEHPDIAKIKGQKAIEILDDLKEERIRSMWLIAFSTIIDQTKC